MSFAPLQMFMDFGLISILLFMAHIIRSRITLFQKIYMPSSLIAGFIALFGGWQFLNILPFSMREDGTPHMSYYPYLLVIMLFATLFMGKKNKGVSLKKMIREVGDTFFYNLAMV